VVDFNRFADNYSKVLDQSTSLSGESSEYFVDYKANYLTRVLGRGRWKILDYGCGIGTLSSAMASRLAGSTIHGFDVSQDSIRNVDPKLSASGIFTTDLTDLDTDYSLITISNVLHHIEPPDREPAFREIAARLAPGGKILVFEHNPLNPLTRWVVAHCPFDDGVHLLTPGEVSGYFRRVGLRKVSRDYIVFFPKALAPLRSFERALGWCPAGGQFAMLGQKEAGGVL
jgi:SAM-dependent methyltransferase